MTIEYRPLKSDELDAFAAAEDSAYTITWSENDRAAFKRHFDLDRSLAAFDGGRPVGGACYYRLGLSVPGGEVSSGGVTFVFVQPTHRRRGIVTELMRRQLEMMRDEGIAVAALHAAESAIYGRFGYGPAAHTEVLEIETTRAAMKSPVSPAGSFRLVDNEEANRVFPAIYDRYRSETPGLFSRDDRWWALRLREPGRVDDSPGWFKVLYERDGGHAGYAIYTANDDWRGALSESKLSVIEMATVDRESYAAIWHYLFSVDLIRTVSAYSAIDPPIWWMLSDRRRLKRQVRDGLWARLVDLPTALEGRKYSADGSITIKVEDDFCPWNSGVYELNSSDGVGTCKAGSGLPDITLDAAGLASCYLGGSSFHTLVAAGEADEHSSGTAALADRMFAWHTAPITSAPEPLV